MATDTSKATERFSNAVRSLREMRGLSAAQLAENAGIGRNTLFLIEAKSSNVRLSTVEKFSFYFGVSPARLFSFRLSEASVRKDAANWKVRSQSLKEGFLREAVSQNISFYRNDRGLTQQAFFDHDRLAHGHLSKIERTSPDLYVGTLERIAEELVVALPLLLKVD